MPVPSVQALQPAVGDLLPAVDDSLDARRLWACAVARKDATTTLRLPSPSGSRARTVALADALRGDWPHAVEVAEHLVVVDADAKPPVEPEAAFKVLWDLAELADLYGLPWIVTASGGGGGHLYLSVPGGPAAVAELGLVCRAVPGVDVVRAGSGRIRPPGTRHRAARQGAPQRVRVLSPTPDAAYRLLTGPPTGDPSALTAAITRLLVPHTSVTTIRAPSGVPASSRRGLSRWATDIVSGPAPAEGHRSGPAYGVLADAVRAGWTFNEWCHYIDGTWLLDYHRSKERNLQRRLQREWTRAQRTARTVPTRTADTGGISQLDRLRVGVATGPGIDARWWRVGGAAVLDCVLALGAATKNTTLPLSVRHAAEKAGMSKSAAHRHLHRLAQHGLIGLADTQDGHGCLAVTINQDAIAALAVPQPGPQPLEGEGQECPTSCATDEVAREVLGRLSARHADVFVSGGLGHACWRVWAAAPAGTTQLGVSSRWARQLGDRASRAGLNSCDEHELLEAAAQLGVCGAGAIRAARHWDEREAFRPVAARIVSAQSQRQMVLDAA